MNKLPNHQHVYVSHLILEEEKWYFDNCDSEVNIVEGLTDNGRVGTDTCTHCPFTLVSLFFQMWVTSKDPIQ